MYCSQPKSRVRACVRACTPACISQTSNPVHQSGNIYPIQIGQRSGRVSGSKLIQQLFPARLQIQNRYLGHTDVSGFNRANAALCIVSNTANECKLLFRPHKREPILSVSEYTFNIYRRTQIGSHHGSRIFYINPGSVLKATIHE